ncbi:integration host factor, actinobacterial type [Streptomyces sp. NPDC006283]|uniref:integration host factor, actinobacterial type n=1 Tax=Streptomyces sp. NPDC006283 TaxID=3156741 RepID=UPI0033BD55D7
MAFPSLTEEQRSQALAKALENRKERAALLAQLKSGSLSLEKVLNREDQVVTRIPVRRVLESLPGIGRVRAGHLLHDLGISPRRRVQGLGSRQKEALLQHFPSHAG